MLIENVLGWILLTSENRPTTLQMNKTMLDEWKVLKNIQEPFVVHFNASSGVPVG